MQERVKEVELEAKKRKDELKSKISQANQDHEFNLKQKDKEYERLKSQIVAQEQQSNEFVELLDKLSKRDEAMHGEYSRTRKGDPKGDMPSIDYIKDMDLDDIDLITERLCKYGLTFDGTTASQVLVKNQRPKIPKLDLEIVLKMLEKDNEYDEYEEEEEEAEEECASGKSF
jgi:hypothetical protein